MVERPSRRDARHRHRGKTAEAVGGAEQGFSLQAVFELQRSVGGLEREVEGANRRLDSWSEAIGRIPVIEHRLQSLEDKADRQQRDLDWLKKSVNRARGAAVVIGVLFTLAVGVAGWIANNRFDEIARMLANAG